MITRVSLPESDRYLRRLKIRQLSHWFLGDEGKYPGFDSADGIAIQKGFGVDVNTTFIVRIGLMMSANPAVGRGK